MQVAANPAPRWHFAGWTGEESGSEPRQAVVMDAAKSLAAVFARSEPLRPGATKDVTPRTSSRFQLYGGRDGYDVLVPPDATELTVRFRSSSAAEADLYVRRGSEVPSEPGDAGETPCIHADFESTSRGAYETIAIKRKSTPRMASDVYCIGLAVPRRQRRIRGTLWVEIRRSGIVKARPAALTCVSPAGSDPGPQTLRLTHQATGAVRYRIVSNATWLPGQPAGMGSCGSRHARGFHHGRQCGHGGRHSRGRADGPASRRRGSSRQLDSDGCRDSSGLCGRSRQRQQRRKPKA